MNSLSLGLAIAAILFSLPTLVISILALSYVVGLKNSTHQIQFVPSDSKDALTGEDVDSADLLESSFDDDEAIHI